MQVAPYGSWISPLSAEIVADGGEPVHRARFGPGGIFYSARISDEDGRTGIFVNRTGVLGKAESILPAGFNVRSRVHEYGGGAWEIDPDAGRIVFVDASDQRLYSFDSTANRRRPVPLTPDTDATVRYGDLIRSGGRILAVREEHGDGHDDDSTRIRRSIVDVDEHGVRELAAGPRFLAWPRVSPRGEYLSFIGWDHPDMPWDRTRLYVVRLHEGVPLGRPVPIFGAEEESVLQPEWVSGDVLIVSSDRGGFWDLHRIDVPAHLARAEGTPGIGHAEDVPLLTAAGEVGGALWTLGTRWFLPVQGGNRLVVEARGDTSRLLWVDARDGDSHVLDCELSHFEIQDYRDGVVLLIGGGAQQVDGLYAYDVAARTLRPVALSRERLLGARYYPTPEVREFDGVHAIVHPPYSPDFTGPDDEAPPYVAFIHGGPTGQAVPRVSPRHAYFTSRGIGVVDVNYGGSTGYGRAYRNRLRGMWGIVDVEDAITVVDGLVRESLADGDRLAISGGSAGGWTVLSALTTTDVFACGTSYYGVAAPQRFMKETHDFESRYMDTLIGPWPEAAAEYERRSPLSNLAGLSAPVAIFQGADDPIVPRSQAEHLIEALRRHDLPFLATIYPGESHGFVRKETIIDALESELGFYGKVMGFVTPGLRAVHLQGRGR